MARLAPSRTLPLSGASVPSQQIGQRGLAAAVRPHDTDAIAALDAGREPRHNRSSLVGFAGVPGFDDQLARIVRLCRFKFCAAQCTAIGAPRLAQRMQVAEPLDVALAPRRNAVAQPMFFGDDLAIELVLIALLLRQHLVAPRFERGEAALDPPRLSAIQPYGAARQSGEESPVVADHQQRRAAAVELALEPFDGGQIEMVGGLIEQKDVRLRREHACERRAARLPARQLRGILAAAQPQLFEGVSGLIADHCRDRAVLRHRPAWSAHRQSRAPAADNGCSRPAARTACRCRDRPVRRRS